MRDTDQELLAVCQVLLYEQETGSMFARVAGAEELATILEAVETDEARDAMLERLCDTGVVWQVLFALAKRADDEVLYDHIADVLSQRYEWGSHVIDVAATWTLRNRRHNTYEWLETAVSHITDGDMLENETVKWPRIRAAALKRVEDLRGTRL